MIFKKKKIIFTPYDIKIASLVCFTKVARVLQRNNGPNIIEVSTRGSKETTIQKLHGCYILKIILAAM
jgi:hypothetical protein